MGVPGGVNSTDDDDGDEGDAPVNDDGGERDFPVNHDVTREIFVRLPAKNLIPLTSVSKGWRSFIFSNEFRHLHMIRHKLQPSLLFEVSAGEFFYLNPIINGENNRRLIPYSFPRDLPKPKILSSCNGLMLLECDTTSKIEGTFGTYYYVYNPTTRESREVPDLGFNSDYPGIMGPTLVFDPTKSTDYKIVCVSASRKDRPGDRSYIVKVYDSVSHSWKIRLEPFTTRCTDFKDPKKKHTVSYGVHCNNSVYWKRSGDALTSDDAFLYYDIDKNVIGSLPPPDIQGQQFDDLKRAFRVSKLQESNGHLYLFLINGGVTKAALWELQENHHSRSWSSKYNDYLSEEFGPLPEESGLLRLISGSDGQEEPSTLLFHVDGTIKAYCFRSMRVEMLVDFTGEEFYKRKSLQFDFQGVHLFGETLAPVQLT